MSLNLGTILRSSSRNFATHTAAILQDRKLSYQQMDALACQVANWLQKQGVKKGDHVALMMPNVPQFTTSYFGILYTGATVVPLNVMLKGQEIEYFLENSDADIFIFHELFAEEALKAIKLLNKGTKALIYSGTAATGAQSELSKTLDPQQIFWANTVLETMPTEFDLAPTQADDTAVILYTSGTTGKSKGAELTHFNMYENARYSNERMMMKDPNLIVPYTSSDVALACLPLFHSFGQTVVQNGFLFNGSSICYLPKFVPQDAAQLIHSQKITFFAGVPTMYFALLTLPEAEAKTQLKSLKFCVSGGASLPVEVLNNFEARFGVSILEGYGLSETSPIATFNSLWKGRKVGSVGPAIFNCEVKIVDAKGQALAVDEIGEIWIRGSNIMKGYYKNKEATKESINESGWFASGDIGRKDADGFVFILDRKKDMIIRGGYNVYPREVEEFLYTHPAVREAAVIGLPDSKLGEEIKAFISLKAGQTTTPEAIMEFCKENLAAYKYPRSVEILADLPKGPTGKLLKRELKVK